MAVTGKLAFSKLHELGEERLGKIDEMLARGMPASQVAMVVQQEWHLWADQKPGTLKKMFERYRRTELRERIVRQVAGVANGMNVRALSRRLNALDELSSLVEVQTGRFRKMLVREQQAPLLLKQVSDEGRLLKEMLVELGKLQLETGVLQRSPRKISGTMTDANGTVQQFEWTVEQEALFKQIESTDYVSIAG
jgi:hypothetical protein